MSKVNTVNIAQLHTEALLHNEFVDIYRDKASWVEASEEGFEEFSEAAEAQIAVIFATRKKLNITI